MYVNGPTNDETTASDPAPRGRISQRANPYAYSDPDLLGFSLKPPKFVRKIGSALKKPLAIAGVVASLVPIPGGSIAQRVVGSTVGRLFKRGQQIDRTVKNVVQRVAVSPAAAPLPIPVAVIRAGESIAPTEGTEAPTASPTGGVVPEVQAGPALERTSTATAARVMRGARKLAGTVDRARAAADSLSRAAAAAADAGDELGAKRLAAQARAISEGAAQVASGASQASGAIQGAAEGAITGAGAATVADQAKEFLSTTTGKVVAGGAALAGVLLLTSGQGGNTRTWR